MARAMRNKALLSEESLDAIEQAVADAEKVTSCEYIVVLAPASDRYEGRVMKTGALAALLGFAIIYSVNYWLYGQPDALWLLLESVVIGAIVAFAFDRLAPLRRLIIPAWKMNACVEAAAGATFFEENVSLTKDRNAVLLYISVFEGEVRLLPDIGVQQKLHDATINEIKAKLANADIGDATDLVCESIRSLGHHCKECYPIQDDDENELPDRPQIRMP